MYILKCTYTLYTVGPFCGLLFAYNFRCNVAVVFVVVTETMYYDAKREEEAAE